MHRNLRYSAARLFIKKKPIFFRSRAKKNPPKFARSSSSLQPSRHLLIGAEKKTYLSPIDSKRRTPLVGLHRDGSRRCRFQAVVLCLQAYVSSLSPYLSLLSHSPVSLSDISPPDLSLLSLPPPDLSVLSLPISLLSQRKIGRESRERSGGGESKERDRMEREHREWWGREQREIESKI